MTTAYSTNLGLALPVQGELSGTWGDMVDNGITQYLDIAIAGTLSLTSASFTANALTLANTNGTSAATNIGATTAQYMVLKVSSLAANVTITAPSTSKLYLVDNADPTYTVTIKASGQTGYTVAVSTRAWVYFNGTDYVLASTNNRNSLTGTLTTANGGTGQTSYTDGQLLIGNTSTGGLSKSTLTQGSGVTITNGAGSITISATGTGGDVVGPASATANAIALFNGTTGKIIKDSATLLPTGALVGTTDTQTLTNKRLTPRIISIADAATITPTGDTADQYEVTALAQAATIAAPSGTPTDGQKLVLRILDNGTARALTWTTTSGAYRAVGVTLPTTTVLSKVLYVGCIYNSQASFWDVVAVAQQA